MNAYAYALMITLVPAIELRGAIPVAIAFGGNPLFVFLAATAANILLIFPIFFFLDSIFPYLRKVGLIDRILERVQKKAAPYVGRYGTQGLLVFVAVPLPGSGAYSGCLAAHVLGIPRRRAILAIAGGVLIAGIAVTAAVMGIVAGLKFFL